MKDLMYVICVIGLAIGVGLATKNVIMNPQPVYWFAMGIAIASCGIVSWMLGGKFADHKAKFSTGWEEQS